MKRLFSPSTLGFYPAPATGEGESNPQQDYLDVGSLPDDLIEMIDADERLMREQPAGAKLSATADGRPVWVEADPLTKEQVEAIRRQKYADPVTGSDVLFAEYNREMVMGNLEAAEAVKEKAIARYTEIQAENPYP